jgi:hypothetical protein
MRLTSLARRSVATLAATALVSGGLAAGLATPASAAPATITKVSPSSWDNRSKVTLTITGSNFSLNDTVVLSPYCAVTPNPAVTPSCPAASTLSGPEVGDLEYDADPAFPTDTELTADADFTMAPPGFYRVTVRHNGDGTTSSPWSGFFQVFAYGPASSSSTVAGVGASSVDPFGIDCQTQINGNGCGRSGALPLDVRGSNFAIGAKVEFLKSDGTPDDGLPFTPGNPSNGQNVQGTSDDTGYPTASLIQGSYDTLLNSDAGQTAKFASGWHDVRVTNTDRQTGGAMARFAQPYFAKVGALSLPDSATADTPTASDTIGQGAKGKFVRVTGSGFREGSTLSIERQSTNTCGDVSVGPSTLGGKQSDGLYTTITAPVTFADCSSPNNTPRRVGVVGPDGGRFFRSGLLQVAPAPTFTDFELDQYQTLGQGARVGFGDSPSNWVLITGTGFEGVGQPDTAAGRAHMVSFDFGPGVTVTTRQVNAVSGSNNTSAFVSIAVDQDAGTGERAVRVSNPNGGSTLNDCDRDPATEMCDLTGDGAPLTITVGPKITKIERDASTPPMSPGQSTPTKFTVTGSGFQSSGYTPGSSFVVALPGETTQDPNITVQSLLRQSATSLTFQASAGSNAAQGPRDIIITNDDFGRFVCSDCLGVNTLAVSPTSGNSSSVQTLSLTVLQSGLPAMTLGSRVVLSHQTPAPGQPDLVGVMKTAPNATTGTATLVIPSGTALGAYNVTVVLDPNSATPKTATCGGCFTVTGAAFQLDPNAPVTPNDGGRGVQDRKLTFKGTDFTRGMDVSIPDVTVHDVTFVSSTQITALVDIAQDAVTGQKTGTVTAGDGTTKTFTFTVNPAPVVKSISPTALGAGAGSPGSPDDALASSGPKAVVTVSGTGFRVSPPSQINLGPNTGVGAETVDPGDAPTCVPFVGCSGGTDDTVKGNAAISQTAALGKRAVSVVNSDGGVGTLADAFTVNPGPKISSIANASGQPILCRPSVSTCHNPQAITVLGSDFPSPSTDAAKKAAFQLQNANGSQATDITVDNIVFTPGKITANVSVAAGRALGALKAVVYNANDKGFGSCSTCLAVALPPAPPANMHLFAGPSSLQVTWAAPNNNGSPITGYRVTLQRVGSTTVVARNLPGTARSTTFTGLLNGWKYVAKVTAANAAGVSSPATLTGQPGLWTWISGGTSAKVVTAGNGVTIGGRLMHSSSPVAGRTVKLLIDPVVGASFTRTTTTNSSGVYAYRFYPRYHFAVRPYFSGDATYRPVVGPLLKVTVPARVTRTSPASGSRSSSSTTLTIRGTVFPSHPGVYVYLYRFTSSGKSLISRVKLSSTSTFTFTGKPRRGTYTFRVYIPATTGNSANYSSAFTIYRT